MKVIDLLNKINKGEEIPKKVKYEDTIFAYDKDRKEYIEQEYFGKLAKEKGE